MNIEAFKAALRECIEECAQESFFTSLAAKFVCCLELPGDAPPLFLTFETRAQLEAFAVGFSLTSGAPMTVENESDGGCVIEIDASAQLAGVMAW